MIFLFINHRVRLCPLKFALLIKLVIESDLTFNQIRKKKKRKKSDLADMVSKIQGIVHDIIILVFVTT